MHKGRFIGKLLTSRLTGPKEEAREVALGWESQGRGKRTRESTLAETEERRDRERERERATRSGIGCGVLKPPSDTPTQYNKQGHPTPTRPPPNSSKLTHQLEARHANL